MRRKLAGVLGIVLSLGGVSLASAADLLTKAPVPPATVAAPYNWGGWYVGGNIGYGWGVPSDPSLSFVDGGVGLTGYFAAGGNVTPDLKPAGMLGGGQIGFNWASTPNWVAGFVADFQGSSVKDSATNTVTPPGGFITTNQTNSEQIDWFGTVRAKLGYAQNSWLLYATGGVAYGRVATSGSLIAPGVAIVNFTGSTSTTNAGWTAGAGLNYGLTSNWIVGIEYLYVDLGNVSYTELGPALGSSITISNRAAFQLVRGSLDYKF